MIDIIKDPVEAFEKFAERMEAGDIDGLTRFYDPDVVIVVEPGKVMTGLEALRAFLAPIAAMKPKMTFIPVSVLEADGVAQLSYRWALRGKAPDGSVIEQSGVSSDVMRRRPDGSWAIIIDHSNGGARPHAS